MVNLTVASFTLPEWANHMMAHGYPILTTGDGSEDDDSDLRFPPDFEPSQVMYNTEAAGFALGTGTSVASVCIIDYGSRKQQEAREKRGKEAGAKWAKQDGEM